MSAAAEAEDLGPALQVEDALTVMVVILVLRLVLFVPLMSLDRARLDPAEKESFWEQTWERVRGAPADAAASPYADAFGLSGKAASVSVRGQVRFIEAADADQNLTVIRHDPAAQGYRLLYVQKFSAVPSFRHGRIKWSPREGKWFTLDDQVDYAATPEAEALLKEYKDWAAQRGGAR